MLNKRAGLIMLVMSLIITTSCKKDFTTIGNNLIDKPSFEGKLFEGTKITAYDQSVPKVFSTFSIDANKNNLPVTSLGIYKDDKYGTLEADVAADINPDINKLSQDLGDNIKILEAKFIAPYFSHTKTENQSTFYELDSIFGHQKFEIKIHELTYLLHSFDPNTNLEELRGYYSDFDFTPYKGDVIGDTVDFSVSSLPYITYKRNEDGTLELGDDGHPVVKDSLEPHMVIKLDTTYFRHKIFDHSGEDILTNADKFKDYFRGLYFDAIAQNGDGRFIMLPLNQGKIFLSYTAEEMDDNGTPDDTSDDTLKTVYKELTFKVGASTMVNHYNNTLTPYAQTALNNSDLINGDDQLILKGDAGSEAVIQLFTEQQLRDLRLNDWMINQADLYFYVDKATSDELLEKSKRLLLYDYDNQRVLTDLFAPENSPDYDYPAFDGKLHEDENGETYFKFGITRHIRNVLKVDSTNVRLGLRVCSNINRQLKVKDIFKDPDAYNPTGIILYGNQSAVKPPVLKIYYTDPK
jgi:hypothetical protein